MASYDASQQNHSSPTPSSVALSTDWPSGRNELAHAKKAGCWKDGRRVGRGFPQPCLQAHHARAIARGKKTVEGRPGGGWLKNVQADDYINFQVPRGRRLIVRVLRATYHDSFDDMLRAHGVDALLPYSFPHTADSYDEAEAAAFYRTFKNRRGTYAELEKSHGAVGLEGMDWRGSSQRTNAALAQVF